MAPTLERRRYEGGRREKRKARKEEERKWRPNAEVGLNREYTY